MPFQLGKPLPYKWVFKAPFKKPGRKPRYYGIIWNILRDNCTCRDDSTVSDSYTRKDDHSISDPNVIANFGSNPLFWIS